MVAQVSSGGGTTAGPMGGGGPMPAPISNEEYIWDYLIQQGFSPAQTAGIEGNIEQESGFNPESVQQGGPGRGIAQWSAGGRWQPGLMTGNVRADLNNQLNYMMQELNNTPGYGLAQLRQATTPQQAAQIFGTDYERYGVAGNRVNDAGAIMIQAQQGDYATNPQAAANQMGGPLAGAVGGQLGQQGAANAYGQANLGLSNAYAQSNNQLTTAQLQANLQNTLAGLGIQKTGLEQQGQYETNQTNAEQQSITNQLANLASQYGFQQQQFGLQGQELGQQQTQAHQQYDTGLHNLNSQDVASGVYNTNTQQYGQGQLAQQLQNALTNIGFQQQGLGIAQQQAGSEYNFNVGQEGLQRIELGNTSQYQQQQLQNALAQLGLSQQEAQQGFGFGVEQAQQSLANTLSQNALQAGALANQTEQGGIGTYGNLLGAIGG